MEATCRRAVDLGLPAVAFTEHAEFTPWFVGSENDLDEHYRPFVSGGMLVPPPLDVDGYLECVERCRSRFPSLRIVSGVELSEPHLYPERFRSLLAGGRFERVLGSMHSRHMEGGWGHIELGYAEGPAVEVVREYLQETKRLIEEFDGFDVLAHIDYPLRWWPAEVPPPDPTDLEDEYRAALRALAAGGRVLEVNTMVPLDARIVRWWHEEGGAAVSFGSDTHEPARVARGFREARLMVEASGFRAAEDPTAFFVRA